MKDEKAFSLIEVIIAILIITTGLIALSAALVIGVTLPGRARQQEIAKQLANTIMESIISAKESGREGFVYDNINYTSQGRFVPGVETMLEAGPDGVYGTCDDGQAPGPFNASCGTQGTRVLQLDIDPGPDGKYSTTGDNRRIRLFNFTREIIIKNMPDGVNPPTYKEIEVRVNYATPTGSRDKVILICQLTNFRTL
jgi:type II secretory pathway pseudopilin PulG